MSQQAKKNQHKSDKTSFFKKKRKKSKLRANYIQVLALKKWHNFHALRFKIALVKAQRRQKCPLSLKIVDSVNKMCQLHWCIEGGGGRMKRGGWSVQNVDRDRKWPGNWTRNTNEPVPEPWHSNSAGLKSVLQLSRNETDLVENWVISMNKL